MPDNQNIRRYPATAAVAAAACAFVALLGGCLLGPRAGTSTTTENTIAGVARLADGSAASGASVSVRTSDISLTKDNTPVATVLAFAVAGSDGAFSLTVPGKAGYFVEIEATVQDSVGIPQMAGPVSAPHSEIWFREFDRSPEKLTALGNVDLEPAATVSGRLEAYSDWAGQAVWIGVPGTGRFTRLDFPAIGDSSVAFILDRVPPGDNPLVLVVPGEPGVSSTGFVQPYALGSAKVPPGGSGDVGILKRPPSN